MSGARQLVGQDEHIETGAPSDVEARARRMGWTDKAEFKGDPSRWMPAEDFVARGDELMPIMRSRLIKQDRVLESTQKELQSVRELMEGMRTAAQRNEQRAYERARSEIEAERAAAVQSADTTAFQAAEARMKTLDTEHAATKTTPAPEPRRDQAAVAAPEIVDWVNRQPWFNRNQAATAMAIAVQARLQQDNPQMAINDNLAEVERRVRGAFPEEFPVARRDAPAAVSGSSNNTSARRSGKKTFDDLPADERAGARKAFEKYKRQMPDYTEQEYLDNYDWS